MPNYKERTAECPHCGRRVLARRKAVSGGAALLHLILSIVTFGLWLVVWWWHGLERMTGDWRCAVCGTKVKPLRGA